MPTVLSHPAVPLALGFGLGRKIVPSRLMMAGVVASILPDFDVLAFRLGVPYESAFGHRGFTHSLAFAVAVAIVGSFAARYFRASLIATFVFLFVAAASHGVLDSFTNGGLGVALFWPWSDRRFFAPFQFIEVSPIGVTGILSARGVTVFASEFLFVWLPFGLIALGLLALRRILPGRDSGRSSSL